MRAHTHKGSLFFFVFFLPDSALKILSPCWCWLFSLILHPVGCVDSVYLWFYTFVLLLSGFWVPLILRSCFAAVWTGTFDSLVFVCCVDSFDSTVFLCSVDLCTPFGSFCDESFSKQRVCYVGFYTHGWILCLSLLRFWCFVVQRCWSTYTFHGWFWVILKEEPCVENQMRLDVEKLRDQTTPTIANLWFFFSIDLDGFFLLWSWWFLSPLMMILMVSFASDDDLHGFFRLWWWSSWFLSPLMMVFMVSFASDDDLHGFFCLWWWSWWFLSPLMMIFMVSFASDDDLHGFFRLWWWSWSFLSPLILMVSFLLWSWWFLWPLILMVSLTSDDDFDGFFCLWWWSWWFLSPLNLLDCFFIFWSRVRQVP